MSMYFIVAVAAYLLGSIPFGYILVRVFRGEDVRKTGSGNIGATNVARAGAPGLGIATLILDAAKGFAAVVVAQRLAPAESAPLAALAALFAIFGHVFPVWLKFKGGKGVATGVGAFLAVAPKAVLIVLVIFFAIVAVSRYVSLGSIIATAAFPVFAYLLNRQEFPPGVVAVMFFAAFLIIAKHHQNIRRLLAGTEHRFGMKQR
jgi:glycerol-3-phosphate acyltransferase PlsY